MTDQALAIFLNWMLLHAAGLASQVIIFDRCFARRHSMAVWAFYFITRGILRAYLSATMAAGTMGPGLLTFDVIFVVATAVANFAVLWYTWDAEALKIGIAGIVSDLLAGVAMVISVSAANFASGGAFTPSMITLSPVMTAAASIVMVMMVLAMLWLLRPLTRWFGAVEFRHRKLLTAVIIIGAAVFSITNLSDNAGFDSSIFIVWLVAILVLVPVSVYILKTLDMQRNRRNLLRQRADMTSAYMLAVDNQTGSLTEYRQLLDSLAARIESADSGQTNSDLRQYVKELRARSDSLRSGRYSSNIAVDAVLTAFAGRFEALGCDAEFRADTAGTDDSRPAEISLVLLNWAENVMSSGTVSSLDYRVMRQANQMILCLTMTGAGRIRFPERMLRGYIAGSDVIDQSRKNGVYILKVMTGSETEDAYRKEAE